MRPPALRKKPTCSGRPSVLRPLVLKINNTLLSPAGKLHYCVLKENLSLKTTCLERLIKVISYRITCLETTVSRNHISLETTFLMTSPFSQEIACLKRPLVFSGHLILAVGEWMVTQDRFYCISDDSYDKCHIFCI